MELHFVLLIFIYVRRYHLRFRLPPIGCEYTCNHLHVAVQKVEKIFKFFDYTINVTKSIKYKGNIAISIYSNLVLNKLASRICKFTLENR